MKKRYLYIVLLCSVGTTLVFFLDYSKRKSWHQFFKPPTITVKNFLNKKDALKKTHIIKKQIDGQAAFKKQPPVKFVFSDIIDHMDPAEEPNTHLEKEAMETEVDYKIEKQTIDKKQKQLQKKKPQQPKKKEDKDFFEAAFDKKVTKPSLKKNKCFWIGYLAGKQELKHGRSIKITTAEPFYFKGTTIPQGASLYGKVLFSKERILAKLETAVFHNNTIPVEIALYDIDYALGILVENLSPFIENAQNTLLQRMVSSTNYSIINDLGNSALHAISTIKNDKKITLENKKKVLLKPIEQNTR